MDKVKVLTRRAGESDDKTAHEFFLGKGIIELAKDKLIEAFREMYPDSYVTLKWYDVSTEEKTPMNRCLKEPIGMERDREVMSFDDFEKRWSYDNR